MIPITSLAISCTVAFATGLVWILLKGGSFLTFLAVYAVSGQILFIALVLAFYALNWARDRHHHRASHGKACIEKAS